jgi:hypothetical protein
MNDQIRSICNKSYFHLHHIAQIKKFLFVSALAQLVHAFVTSTLDYGNSLLVEIPSYHLDKLQRVKNAAARLISGKNKFDNITDVLIKLHWPPVSSRIVFKIPTLKYRCLNNCAPVYLPTLIAISIIS